MNGSYIYSDIPREFLCRAGYFEPKAKFKPLSRQSFVHNLSGKNMTPDTLVVYFPGSFGHFHEGHLDVVKRAYHDALKICKNFVIVISPSHTDYAVEKYGNTTFALNKTRYDRIMELKDELLKYNVVIDLNPMLNFTCDHNFTDILKFFVDTSIAPIDTMNRKPVLVFGKDRYYNSITCYTDKVSSWFYPETVTRSTSKDFVSKEIPKKDLYLRVRSSDEFDCFVKYMKPFYKSITMISIHDERSIVKSIAKKRKVITICKDYADLVPYVSVSRTYEHPLSDAEHRYSKLTNVKRQQIFKEYSDSLVIDSDIFTGGTMRYIESMGCEFHALVDMRAKHNVELLDIDDFKKDDFMYPYVDLSSKCSLPAFTYDLYSVIVELIKELRTIK